MVKATTAQLEFANAPRTFMDERFLLQTKTARRLFEEYAKDAPILDYHCHIPPSDVAEDRRFANLTELWLGGDHYKWRALRSNGVAEHFITGNASDWEKFEKWAETMPKLIGNPLYHWTHLELQRYFDVHAVLGPATAKEIWEIGKAKLAEPGFSARSLILRSNVTVFCTTDDPTDNLEHHRTLAADSSFPARMLPTFRPDKALYLERAGFAEWVAKLGTVTGKSISTLQELMDALSGRMDVFAAAGCRLSDHSLEPVVFEAGTDAEADDAFRKALSGSTPEPVEIRRYRSRLLIHLGKKYADLGWTMQLHMLAQRNNNTVMFRAIGPDTGFDTMGDDGVTMPLSRLLDAMALEGGLPKTILYSLNGKDLDALGAMAGCFQDGSVPGKIQLGAPWWFNDQRDGMERQLRTLGNLGVLGRFVGMLTDSRSLVSYPRHEYFRRILCNLLGGWMEDGELPDDMGLVGGIVRDICHRNAENYFQFPRHPGNV